MELQKVCIVLLADLVARKNDDILGLIAFDKGNVLINGVGRALIPVAAIGLLIRRQHMYTAVQTVKVPRLAVADILVQLQRLILGADAHGINVGIHTVRNGKIDDSILSTKRNCRLSSFLGQRIQARPLAAGQDHCYHFF